MLSHVFVGITAFEPAFDFYSDVMAVLGLDLKFADPDVPWAGWQQPSAERPFFLIGRAFNGEPATPGNGQMIALLAKSRATVDACHAAALAAGGTCEGPPGLRPRYHPDYYGAYFRDPDGNKLCVCCHEPV
ncbi:MAG TPA: VOC family protein [Rhodopila sp.]|uniref:VOC family protein n=1 Tax=Rhodopila sp. TaxID=2480087 RepID=UPI002C0C7F2C|nr:VOC family protein [Rhodopila sp.]HVY17764.1 VOC family protein [Rhodopila sp.]